MKKIKSLVLLYFLQVIFYSPISFAATAIGSKELEQTNANVGIIYSIFSKELLLNLVFVVIVIIGTFSLSKIVNARLVNYFEKMAEGNEENNREELIGVLTRVANITLITIGTSIILSILGIDVGIFMGGIGFGLGFTLKIFLTNFIAGVLMVSQGFYHNGDFIEILGKMGRIKKINALFTSIEQLDGIIFFVPNVKFLEENVENYNTNNKRRVDVPVGVDYDTDIVKAKTIMINILGNFPSIMKAPEPVVMVTNFGDSSIDLSLRFWIDSKTGKYFEVKSNVMETVNLAFKKAGIVIPFPQVTLNNRNGFELNMQK